MSETSETQESRGNIAPLDEVEYDRIKNLPGSDAIQAWLAEHSIDPSKTKTIPVIYKGEIHQMSIELKDFGTIDMERTVAHKKQK